MKSPFLRRLFLGPWSALYGGILHLRHALYDRGILPSSPGALPTVVLGNLTVGGTGKTPLTEAVASELEAILGPGSVGILSRGYGRKTTGFLWVNRDNRAEEVGDEPLMLCRKLPGMYVAVCENRLEGLRKMRETHPELRWVVCDDALQHRQLQPTIALLVVDATQPVDADHLLPWGRLRDVVTRMEHVDAVVVTRLGDAASDVRAKFASRLPAHRPVFATSMRPQPLRCWPHDAPCNDGDATTSPGRRDRILAVAGIAKPERFMDRLAERFQVVRREAFADHRAYFPEDYQRWKRIIDSDRLHALVTTEKDVVRFPPAGIEGIEIRYEPLEAEWHQPDSLRTWLRQEIASKGR